MRASTKKVRVARQKNLLAAQAAIRNKSRFMSTLRELVAITGNKGSASAVTVADVAHNAKMSLQLASKIAVKLSERKFIGTILASGHHPRVYIPLKTPVAETPSLPPPAVSVVPVVPTGASVNVHMERLNDACVILNLVTVDAETRIRMALKVLG